MKNETRAQITIKNFKAAVQTLEKFVSAPVEDERDRAGIIQAFEFCYELAWQSLRKTAEERGLEAPTPLQAFQAGFQMGFIQDDEQDVWVQMKTDRNLTSHTYKEALAIQVHENIQQTFFPALKKLAEKL